MIDFCVFINRLLGARRRNVRLQIARRRSVRCRLVRFGFLLLRRSG